MQLLQDERKESTEQQQQQTNLTTQANKQQKPSLDRKMDKFYPPKPKISAFNELFTCYLCQGYMVNPTTIDVCTHTYCRSCIARHLAVECCCPQCGKIISISNLTPDDTLRSIIFKLVPGLYQKERERLAQFVNNAKSEGKLIGATTEQSLGELLEVDDDLFAPTDPISLSLEFHPVLAGQCPEDSVPPVRYLQCPASVKMQHLKRFLCSKFEIDPCNSRVSIDIIYDDEILPSDFTLMDVCYCYKWKRHAPLKLAYRILIFNDDMPLNCENSDVSESKITDSSQKTSLEKSLPMPSSLSRTTSQPAEGAPVSGPGAQAEAPLSQTSSSIQQPTKVKPLKSSSLKHSSLHSPPANLEVPVKVTISRKTSENKKSVSKKSSSMHEFVIPTTTNDFKSLRSNDIRFSDYAITSSTTNTVSAHIHTTLARHPAQSLKKEKYLTVKEEKPAKCDVVVSIPHNQMQEEWDMKPLSQLKTASKKSPNSTCPEVPVAAPPPAPTTKKIRNVPKLKIELNSLKTKLIEKPKSADIRLDTLMIKHHRPRKFSLDEPQPVVDKVDLETYVKNIGLKPIEVQTANKLEIVEKYTPNASPMSSSSSTTSSSTSNFNFNCNADITSSSSTSSSHKKRKKKHSKESRESKDSKRKKMHAEISSHSAEESLKMKVKLTPPINLKSLKLQSKKAPLFCVNKTFNPSEFEKSQFVDIKTEQKESEKSTAPEIVPKEKLKSRSSEMKKSSSPEIKFCPDTKRQNDLGKTKPSEIKTASVDNHSKSLSKEFDDDDETAPDSTSLGLSKSLATVKQAKLPHSPPLPPSLFKTTPLTFSTFSPNVAKPKPIATPKKDYKDKPKSPQMKPIAPKPIAFRPSQQSSLSTISSFKTPQIIVPSPSCFTASSGSKFSSTPTSIASAANKHMGNLLKRSISLDSSKNSGPSNKQQRLDKPNQITVSAYGSNLHMTKVEIPPTPTSSTAKATYEIPLYSPLSASYNPKCSFTVNSTTSTAKCTKASLQNPTASSIIPAKQTLDANSVAANKPDMEVKKATVHDIKPSITTISTTSANTMAITNNRTSTTSATTSMASLMGPPLPKQKLNSSLTVVPAPVKSPPPSAFAPFAPSSPINSTSTAQHTPVLSTAYLSSPLSLVNYRQSKVLLAHAKPSNLPEMRTENSTSAKVTAIATITTAAEVTATTTKASACITNGLSTEKSKSSLRQFRLPSRESGQDILDLSAATKAPPNGTTEKQSIKQTLTTVTPAPNNQMTASAGSSLEIALNKIKQNMTTTTTTTNNPSSANPNSLDKAIKKQELLSPISDDLQNLHLLSESATAREKIAICTSTTATSGTTSLYEKAKITPNTLVRQQNASVRNIPNPSALAFRNQQPATIIPPMVTIAAGLATALTDLDKPLLLKTPSPPKSPHSPNCTTSSTSPSRITSKKHPSIDQVAASLNQRASAAAEASAKAKLKSSDETALVSSTSSSLPNKLENKEIKQESAETQGETSVAQPSSTVNSSTCPLVNVLDIKKEPEDKAEETSETKPSAFINATTKKSTMVENLVTSVINVTTPTSTLLTATTAGF